MKQVLQEEINLFSPNYIFIYGDEVRDDLNINDNNGNQNFEICLNIPEHCDDYPVPHTSAWGVSFNQTYLPIINEILPLIQP
jgi:hypothetical protein